MGGFVDPVLLTVGATALIGSGAGLARHRLLRAADTLRAILHEEAPTYHRERLVGSPSAACYRSPTPARGQSRRHVT